MGTWLSIASFGACLAVTVVGLILSAVAWRKLGARSGMRGIAWSLLPLVAYLTGALRLVGGFVSSIVHFAGGFVFSPKSWLGVILAGVAIAFFLLSGGLPLLKWSTRSRKRKKEREQARAGSGQPVTAQRGGPDEGLDGDVDEILRRRGIK